MRPESLGTIDDFREKTTMRMNTFNLNDGRWGRDKDGNPTFDPNAGQQPPAPSDEKKPQEPPRPPAGAGGPPDLDELWRDFNAKLGGLFGGKNGGEPPSNNGGSNGRRRNWNEA